MDNQPKPTTGEWTAERISELINTSGGTLMDSYARVAKEINAAIAAAEAEVQPLVDAFTAIKREKETLMDMLTASGKKQTELRDQLTAEREARIGEQERSNIFERALAAEQGSHDGTRKALTESRDWWKSAAERLEEKVQTLTDALKKIKFNAKDLLEVADIVNDSLSKVKEGK